MRLEARKYLYDIAQAAADIGTFVGKKTYTDYSNDPMLRAAVERKLEVIG